MMRPASIFCIVLFTGVVSLLLLSTVNTSSHKHKATANTTLPPPTENFACVHTYKIPATDRGCFQYKARSGDTCQGIRNTFRTNSHNVRTVAGNSICTDDASTNAGSRRRRSPPSPLTKDDTFRICPPQGCVYHKVKYGLTCGELATRYHTDHKKIHYAKPSAPDKMVVCTDPDNQKIPNGSRAQVCQHESMDHGELLNTTHATTFDNCKTECDAHNRCSHILFGNGVCKQLSSSTPLMNIASSARDTSAYRCAAEAELQYAGATPNEVGTYFSDDSQIAPCKWLGSQGSDRWSKCIPPHTNTAVATRMGACQKKRSCPWESIVASQSEIMNRQQEYLQTDDFLAEVCP